MSKNYYCSGLDINNPFKGELASKLKKDLPITKRIVYIAGSTMKEKIDKTIDKYIPMFTKHFENIGIVFDNINVVIPNVNSKDARYWVENSDMIFLLGGNPFLQKELYESMGLTNLLKNYEGVIMGISAGAMNMSKHIIITPCSEEYPNFQIEDGLNLSNISIYPHINFEGEIIPEKIDLDKEVIEMKDLIEVAKEYGDFYCLQDHYDGVNTNVSIIYESDNKIQILTENDGKTIGVCKDGFHFIDRVESNDKDVIKKK